MKKLMIAGVVGLCAAVTFGLESANIVGYQNAALKHMGYNFVIPTFLDVGASDVDLQNIVLKGAAGDMSESIVVYDEDALLSGEQYYWVSEAMGAPNGDGWYDVNFALVDKQYTIGTGLYLNCATPGASLQFSGQVYSGTQTNNLPFVGYNMIGNSTPVPCNIQDIKLVDAVGDMSESIVVYDKDALLSGEQYYWISSAMGAPNGDGWYDVNFSPVDVTVEPGEGLYLSCPNAGVKWTLPAAL